MVRKLPDRIIFALNILAAIGLLLVYLAPFINPARFFLPALFGLAYPIILLSHLLLIVYWLIRMKKQIFLSLAVVLLGWNHLAGLLPLHSGKQEVPVDCENRESFKVMTYNVRAFGVYPSKNLETQGNIIDLIQGVDPDILCLQEYHTNKVDGQMHADYRKAFRDLPHEATFYTSQKYKNRGTGIATFSRFPILKESRIPFNTYGNAAMYTDLLVEGDTIRVFNIHLQSIRFREENLAFMDTMKLKVSDEQMREIRKIGSQLKQAFAKRAEQADMIANYIEDSPHPVLVMGDFNDTPQSYAYHRIRNGLKDAFRASGRGIGNTYAGDLPSLRIDHILYDGEFVPQHCHRIKNKISDHYPVIGTFCTSKGGE